MGEFFGELERLAADLYPYRWYVIGAVVVGLAAIGAVGYRGRLAPLGVASQDPGRRRRDSGGGSSGVRRVHPRVAAVHERDGGRGAAVRFCDFGQHGRERCGPVYAGAAPVRRRPLPRRQRPPIRRRQCRPRVRRRSRPPRLRTRLPLLHLTPVGCRRRRGRPRRCLSLPPRPCPRRLRDQPLRQRPRPHPLRALRRLPRHCPRRLRRQPPRHPVTRRLSHPPRRPCPGQYRRPARPRLPRLRRRRHRRRQLRQRQPPPLCQPPRRLPVLPRSRLPRRPLELPSS